MKINIEFDTSGDAIDNDPAEIAVLLRKLARRIDEDLVGEGNILDGNGNRVGTWVWA